MLMFPPHMVLLSNSHMLCGSDFLIKINGKHHKRWWVKMYTFLKKTRAAKCNCSIFTKNDSSSSISISAGVPMKPALATIIATRIS